MYQAQRRRSTSPIALRSTSRRLCEHPSLCPKVCRFLYVFSTEYRQKNLQIRPYCSTALSVPARHRTCLTAVQHRSWTLEKKFRFSCRSDNQLQDECCFSLAWSRSMPLSGRLLGATNSESPLPGSESDGRVSQGQMNTAPYFS
eukprot:677891-Rhodomonas_salina.1